MVGGGIQSIDDMRLALLPVEKACLGTLHGVQGGDGARFDGIPYTYTAW